MTYTNLANHHFYSQHSTVLFPLRIKRNENVNAEFISGVGMGMLIYIKKNRGNDNETLQF